MWTLRRTILQICLIFLSIFFQTFVGDVTFHMLLARMFFQFIFYWHNLFRSTCNNFTNSAFHKNHHTINDVNLCPSNLCNSSVLPFLRGIIIFLCLLWWRSIQMKPVSLNLETTWIVIQAYQVLHVMNANVCSYSCHWTWINHDFSIVVSIMTIK